MRFLLDYRLAKLVLVPYPACLICVSWFNDNMRKATTKNSGVRPTKEVSVMAWIEDPANRILLVRQAAGMKLWTLPGGKVKKGESLVRALKRVVREETGLRIEVGSLLGVLDRRDKDAITLLFAAVPGKRSVKAKQKQNEIKKVTFQTSFPNKASPSAKYFWSARRGPIKKAPKIQASTHQFPTQITDEYPRSMEIIPQKKRRKRTH